MILEKLEKYLIVINHHYIDGYKNTRLIKPLQEKIENLYHTK